MGGQFEVWNVSSTEDSDKKFFKIILQGSEPYVQQYLVEIIPNFTFSSVRISSSTSPRYPGTKFGFNSSVLVEPPTRQILGHIFAYNF